jgi:hypothetical protein
MYVLRAGARTGSSSSSSSSSSKASVEANSQLMEVGSNSSCEQKLMASYVVNTWHATVLQLTFM